MIFERHFEDKQDEGGALSEGGIEEEIKKEEKNNGDKKLRIDRLRYKHEQLSTIFQQHKDETSKKIKE